jgi:hypothetical protein
VTTGDAGAASAGGVAGADTPQRIFVVGCPRSGTTLVQSLLAAHPRLLTFPETHLFDRSFGRRKRVLNGTLRGLYIWWIFRAFAAEHLDGAADLRPALGRRLMLRRIIEHLDALALRAGKHGWVDKTPRHLHYVDEILRLVPDAKFVHVIRDGRGVVASLHEAGHRHPSRWRRMRSIEACVARWNESVGISAGFVGRPAHSVISYERVARSPADALQALLPKLGLDFDPCMLERYATVAASVTRSHEQWKSRNSSGIRYEGLQKFEARFTREQRHGIEQALDGRSYRVLLELASG